MWLIAVGAGAFETILVVLSGRAGDGAVVGVTVRLAVFVAAVLVAVRMRAGRNWARWVLAIGLGVLGTLSLVVDPILWLADGNSLSQAVTDLDAVDVSFAVSRVVHVAAVLTACVLMFLPTSNAYMAKRAR